jgi:hypothetical protein
MASYSPRKFPEIVRNSAESKKLRNSAAFRDTEFRIIPRNFWQFRIAYGMYGSKKKHTEFRVDGIPWTPYSQVAWITGESQISRPMSINNTYTKK